METGFFDIPGPLFTWVDALLGNLFPDTVRLILWAIAAGAGSMGLYWLTSPQEKLGQAKVAATEARREMAAYDGDFDGIWPLMRRSLSTSFRHLGLALGPALLGSLPVLFIMAWLAGSYGYNLPEPGQPVRMSAQPAGVTLAWSDDGTRIDSTGEWIVNWPSAGTPRELAGETGEALVTLPLSHAVPIIHKRVWWNSLLANPLGSLPDSARIDVITIELPMKVFLPFGPSWMQGWEMLFIIAVLVASLAIKFAFRIR